MLWAAFLKGASIGFVVAAPVGPIGLLCIRRSLAAGMSSGLVSGLGAATADAAYSAVAAFGLTAVSSFLVGQQFWLGLVGGVLLCALGARTFLAAAPGAATATDRRNLPGAYFSALVLTLTNPLTVLLFAAIFAGLGIDTGADYPVAGAIVLGVFLGSTLWWLVLSSVVGLTRSMVNAYWLRLTNRVSGVLFVAFGAMMLVRSTIH